MEQVLTWNDVYHYMHEVRAMAHRLLRGERNAQSLQTTALVLTAFRRQKLVNQDWSEVAWADRERFLAAMYRAMDRALKDHGRRRAAQKRKALHLIPLEDLAPGALQRTADLQPQDLETALADRPEVIVALTDALAALEHQHPDWAAVAKHRYYGGLTIEQIAAVMGVAERTVRRYWDKARILLYDDILQTLSRHDQSV